MNRETTTRATRTTARAARKTKTTISNRRNK
jgi:hypothetical protein